jgi:prepilin-type N-terminal cleavage/methylation domain-containing protein
MSATSGETQDGFTLVELLVTMLILGVVMSGITSVVVASMRTEQNQRQLQDVIDDGRTRWRVCVRNCGRRDASTRAPGPDRLHFWVDRNQDSLPAPEEQICYVVEPIGTNRTRSAGGRGRTAEDCAPGALPAGRVVGPSSPAACSTPSPSFSYHPAGSITDPPTRRCRSARPAGRRARGPGGNCRRGFDQTEERAVNLLRRINRDEGGIALMTALLAMIILGGMVVVFMSRATRRRASLGRRETGDRDPRRRGRRG